MRTNLISRTNIIVVVCATIIFALSTNLSNAGTMGTICVADNASTPCSHSRWELGVQALYLQPTHSSGFTYVGRSVVGGISEYRPLTPNWSWGFMLEGSYHYTLGNDIQLNWYHLNNQAIFNFDKAFIFLTTVNTAIEQAIQHNKWDALNLEFGQDIDFGKKWDIRVHGGAQYAQIETTLNRSGLGDQTVNPPDFVVAVNDMARFYGFGPRLGANFAYDWGYGFATYAKTAAAVMVGSSKFTQVFTSTRVVFTSASGSKTAIVPEMEVKLGATYTYAIPQGVLTLDAGWMLVNYFNAQVWLATNPLIDNNFAVQGPYFGINWVGDV